MTTAAAPTTPPLVTFELALKDLRHEWILAACLVLALSAILSPLLIVLGLKEGFIGYLREDLVQDPVFREITPSETVERDEAWFNALSARPDVAFVVPGILRGASTALATYEDERAAFDLRPSAPGDPLVVENGGTVPNEGEVAATMAAARALKPLEPETLLGETITLIVTRTRGGVREQATENLKVVAVLDERADVLERLYVSLDLVRDVEAYKEGRAAPERGWDGGVAAPYQSYDGLALVASNPLRPSIRARLTEGTGFSILEELKGPELDAALGVRAPEDASLNRLRSVSGGVTTSSIRSVQRSARGTVDAFLPIVENLKADFMPLPPDGLLDAKLAEWKAPVALGGYSQAHGAADRLGMWAPPWGAVDANASFEEIAQVALPKDHPFAGESRIAARVDVGGGETVIFPIAVAGASPGESAVAPIELAAMLATARERRVVFDPEVGSLVLGGRGYGGFRIYATSIDVAPGLAAHLRDEEGLAITARTQEILRMQGLDRGLSNLFLLIACVGAVGGVAALLASLYAAVERKRAEIGMMRLLGISPLKVFGFPVYQGLAIAAGSLTVSFAVFFTVAWVLNETFSAELGGADAVALPLRFALVIVAAVLIAAAASSCAAAFRATRIEPAEAIRAE